MRFCHSSALSGLLFAASCSSAGAPRLPALTSAPTTLSATLLPTHARIKGVHSQSPNIPSELQTLLSGGFGMYGAASPEPYIVRSPPGVTPPSGPGTNPTLLVRFVHLPDQQIVDDESPTRLAMFDDTGDTNTNAAFRPQEADECRITNAAVRTINALDITTPIAFVLTGGDISDDGQTNEIGWALDIFDGAPSVKCDSGAANDPVPGANNDGKDAFYADGFHMPWYWVTGNHDVLNVGIFPNDDSKRDAALGTSAPLGTRDWSQPGGPIFTGPVVADPRRAPLSRTELMDTVGHHGDGHGLGAAQLQSGKGYYTFDVAGTPLRFVILDTAAETGGSDGIIHMADVNAFIKGALDQAKSDGKWVILSSHHPTDTLNDGSDTGGIQQADALTTADWENFVGGYPNVILSMVGHTHINRVVYITPTTAAHGWFEMMTSALADYPHQFRMVEIWDDGDGFLRITGTNVNYETDGDAVAAEGRTLGITDWTSGWALDGTGTAQDRNVELYIPKPGT